MLKKQRSKPYTHGQAKASILSTPKQQQQRAQHRDPHMHHQGSHGRLRHEGGYSGQSVEPPLLKKRCLLHRRGAYFQNITFPGPVEKGNRDVVNHMPWRTATRHCVHSVMPSCMTLSVISSALARRHNDLARRSRRGRAPPRRIYPFRGAGRGLLRNPFPNRQTEPTAKHL